MNLIVWLIIGIIFFIEFLVMLYIGQKIIWKNKTMGVAVIYSSFMMGAIGAVLICKASITLLHAIIYGLLST